MPPCKIYILKNAHVGRNIISPKKLQDFPCALYLLAATVVYLLNFSKIDASYHTYNDTIFPLMYLVDTD